MHNRLPQANQSTQVANAQHKTTYTTARLFLSIAIGLWTTLLHPVVMSTPAALEAFKFVFSHLSLIIFHSCTQS